MENKLLLIIMFFVCMHVNGMSLPLFPSQLNLSNGFITDIDEIEYGDDYKNISTLDLSKNQIKRFNVKELCRLMPNLKTFSFSHNQIKKLRASMLEGLPEDAYLDLSHNPIEQIGSGVERALACLRDKRITISINGTRLPASVLISLTKSLERSSWAHLLTGIGLMAGGGLAFVGSTVLMIVSDLDGDGQRSVGESVMFGGGMFGIIGGLCLCGAKPIVTCFQHDANQSRLYWYQEV